VATDFATHHAQIDAVATTPALRGRGAGAAAVSAAIRAANADWAHLYTEAAAGPLPFYKSLGFDIAGAIAEWTFTDAGEPGTEDTARIRITNAQGDVVLDVFGPLRKGNHQAHAH